MKKISVVTPTYNEEQNIITLYGRIKDTISKLDNYIFEIIIIDNASSDNTRTLLRELAKKDKSVKLIFNTRNFGHIRSPYWGLMQAHGDAVIYLASDLQDPPEYINRFIDEWEKGWKVVLGTKEKSKTNQITHKLRKLYYLLLDKITDIEIIRDSTGFGLYDKIVINQIRAINDPYPFLRGLISELGYPVKRLQFEQPRREFGVTKNNIYTLYDIALLGIVSHSNIPLRISSFIGYTISILSFILGVAYLVLKINDWYAFPRGVAPIIILMFLFFGLLFIFLGLIGEYISVIYAHIRNRPVVVESERVNFE
jgi:glycosyltransferase involved in cell wall biosynthesis